MTEDVMGGIANNGTDLDYLERYLFPAIAKGNCILFLGAGASVTDSNKYLGKELIDFYSDKLGVPAETTDLVEYIDFVETLPTFSRPSFDDYVTNILKKLEPDSVHEQIVGMDWKEIITTNLDSIIERAYHNVQGTEKEKKIIRPIRTLQEYSSYTSNDEIRYIKINGCISDKSKYNFVFSSKDFDRVARYYKEVLKSLTGYSDQLVVLSIGYSYTDGLAKKMLKTLETQNLSSGRWMYNIDPFVTEERIRFFQSKNIRCLKQNMSDFFKAYKNWENEKGQEIIKRKKINFYNSSANQINLDTSVSLRLAGKIEQLNNYSKHENISALEYFKGATPDFGVVYKNFDVINESVIEDIKKKLHSIEETKENLLPFTFLTGSFGVGKSTAAYRIILELIEKEEKTIAIEILEPDHVKPEDLLLLIEKSGASRVILHCPFIEKITSFKDFMNFRNKISTFQPEIKIHFLSSIRDNVLQFFRSNYEHKNVHEISIEEKLNEEEASELLKKLSNCSALRIIDSQDFKNKKNAILKDYKGSTFVALSQLVENNYFNNFYKSALNEINEEARNAIVYTSLLYKYKIHMPASILMRLVTKNWSDFTDNVLKVDCKGILLHFFNQHNNEGDPDMFFKTKHSILSENIVKSYFKEDKDKLFKAYNKILTNFPSGNYYSRLAIDLIKAIRESNELPQDTIEKLFDNCCSIFETNNHFVLHYAVNLQNRNTIFSYKKAIERLIFVSGFYEKRDHRIIHRRGVINFLIATKLKDTDPNASIEHVEEARELFKIKLLEDRFSSYSFSDFIKLELWVLKNFELEIEGVLNQHIIIQDLFDKADRAVFENAARIKALEAEYIEIAKQDELTDYKSLDEFIDELYEKDEYRYYALILRYNKAIKNNTLTSAIIEEMETYSHLSVVANTLFKHYGRNLHVANVRIKFFNLVKQKPELAVQDPMAYNYYSYISESYNGHFNHSKDNLRTIQENFQFYNPYLQLPWIDSDTNKPQEFTVNIILKKSKLLGSVKELTQVFPICKKTSLINVVEGKKYSCHLLFYLKGIKISIVSEIIDEA